MGISTGKNGKTFDLVVVEDRAKPVEDQRSLKFRFVSIRTSNQIREHLKNAAAAGKTHDFIVEISNGIRLALVGWKNMRTDDGQLIDFDPARLDEVLTEGDFADVAREMMPEMVVAEAEHKGRTLRALAEAEKAAKATPVPAVA